MTGSLRSIIFSLLMLCAVLSLAGTYLILPAVSALPAIFATSEATAQLVLAPYGAGTAIGLLLFGTLADRQSPRTLIASSLSELTGCSLSPCRTISWQFVPNAGWKDLHSTEQCPMFPV